jgi:hypothetical protein
VFHSQAKRRTELVGESLQEFVVAIDHFAHRMGRRGMHIGFWLETQKERRPLGKLRRRWEDNIKMDLRVIGWGGMDWIHPA